MNGGFTFCGIDIADLGLEYVPEMENTYVYAPAESNPHEETFDGHDGGYHFGQSKSPKEFILRMIFEQKEIDKGILSQLFNIFRDGRSGKLVFQRKPWCYYYATVISSDLTGITNYLNGAVTVTMKAYYPYARSDEMHRSRTDENYTDMMENTAVVETEDMIPKMDYTPTTGAITGFDKPILLLNPGTEYAPLSIEIAGDVGSGVLIKNETTRQELKVVAMSSDKFYEEGHFVYIDSLNGKTIEINNGTGKINFLYHNKGFLSLKPAYPATRELYASATNGVVELSNRLYDTHYGEDNDLANEWYKGEYIWLGGWYKITNVIDEQHLQLEDDTVTVGDMNSGIYMMNEITVTPVDSMSLTRMKFIYKPTYA